MSTQIHETAIIDEGAKIGSGSKIWHWTHICSGAQIGSSVTIGQNGFIAPSVRVGNGCKIQNNVSIFEGVILEKNVFCGPSVVFTNVINPRAFVNRKREFKKTYVETGATLGANCTIICGVRLGTFCFVGAGAVVTKDIKPHALMVGVPARQIGWVSEYGEILDLPLDGNGIADCKKSKKKYMLKDGKLSEIF